MGEGRIASCPSKIERNRLFGPRVNGNAGFGGADEDKQSK